MGAVHLGLGAPGGRAKMALFDAKGLPVKGKQRDRPDSPSWGGIVPPGNYYLRVTCEAPCPGPAFVFVMMLPELARPKLPEK